MTHPPATAPSSVAIAAFLRGVGSRARLLATIQAGASLPAGQALAVVAKVFAADAGQWPIAQWPGQYWRLLLATPHLRTPDPAQPGLPLPGVARLPPAQRAAVLLQLVAGLDDATAATALVTSVSAYQDAIRDGLPRNSLGQPDIDVWRAWHAAAQRELAKTEPVEVVSPQSPQSLQSPLRASAPQSTAAPVSASASPSNAVAAKQHHLVRWLWLGVVLCVLAFAITLFLHPAGREVVQRWTTAIKAKPLPPADPPKARFDAGDTTLHPDRELCAAPEEAGYASEMALLSWLAVASEDPRSADAVPLPVMSTVKPRTQIEPARDAAALATRLRQWDSLPARVRGMRRGQWQAWRALSSGERIQLRTIAMRWRVLSPHEQQALRARFNAQASDGRTGWWLGARLGRDWPRIQALFAYVDAGERDALLQFLHRASTQDLDALERLSQGTPPEARAGFRAELLAQPPARRSGWLQAQLER